MLKFIYDRFKYEIKINSGIFFYTYIASFLILFLILMSKTNINTRYLYIKYISALANSTIFSFIVFPEKKNNIIEIVRTSSKKIFIERTILLILCGEILILGLSMLLYIYSKKNFFNTFIDFSVVFLIYSSIITFILSIFDEESISSSIFFSFWVFNFLYWKSIILSKFKYFLLLSDLFTDDKEFLFKNRICLSLLSIILFAISFLVFKKKEYI